MGFDSDVLVAGAGPVGCVAALAYAQRGARVMLLDPSPGQSERFAGELLHPRALRALRAVGVDTVQAASGHDPVRGYAVYGRPKAHPFMLDYDGEQGATFVFGTFLAELRERAASHPLISFLPGARVDEVDGQTVTWTQQRAALRSVQSATVAMVVGAQGKHGVVGPDAPKPERLSSMAGLLLRDVSLPNEGYGHVVLSKIGPALLYRVSPNAVRVCLDVPFPWRRATRRTQLVWEAYRDVLPPSIAQAVHTELLANRVAWAVNAVRPRTAYGREGFAQIGDAVGHFHPMTAVGMTLGFDDALALAAAPSVATYAALRTQQTEVPGLLATALYEMFALQSEPTDACREAIFRLWTSRPDVRARTMGFLGCDETRMSALLTVGTQLVSRAMGEVAAQRTSQLRVQGSLSTARRIAGLIHWLLSEAVPEQMQIPFFQHAATPFAMIRQQQLAQLTADLLAAEAT